MNVKKLDINYLSTLIKSAQASEKFEDPLKEITKLGLQSSCTIYVKEGKAQWSGSGFHVGNGYIITASHVAPPESQSLEIDITFDKQSFYKAEVSSTSPEIDVAILFCRDIINVVPSLQLGNSDTLEVGDMVVVISAPEGFHDTATYGRVSNIHQTLGKNAPSQAWQDIIFIDADIMEGSSGGMVLGTDGLVYGIIMGVTGQHADIGIGESSVSPSNKIKSLIEKL